MTSGTNNIYSSSGAKLTSCGGSCYQLMQYDDGAINPNETYYYYHLIKDSLKIMSTKDVTGKKIMEGIKYEEE